MAGTLTGAQISGNLSDKIALAQDTADLEMTAYLAQMNDAERGVYAGKNASTAINKILGTKTDRFNYLSEDMMGADNNITSTAYYITRTKDLTQMASDIDVVATKQLAAAGINAGLAGRQNEINEWANENKLDTLFFLQILFISLSFMTVILFLKSNGIISSYLLNLFIVLTSALSIFVLISRARFTNSVRDSRYWNKNRFPGNVPPPAADTPQCPGDIPTPPPAPPAPKQMVCSMK